MPKPSPKHVEIAVAGGSIAGLCAGNALLSAGFDVHVFERSAARLWSHGAGIVVDEPQLDSGLIDHFEETFSFCRTAGGGHGLCYFIPGSDLATGRGGRRLN